MLDNRFKMCKIYRGLRAGGAELTTYSCDSVSAHTDIPGTHTKRETEREERGER